MTARRSEHRKTPQPIGPGGNYNKRGRPVTLTQLTNEATRLLAAERAATPDDAARIRAERDHIENMIRDRYQTLLKSH